MALGGSVVLFESKLTYLTLGSMKHVTIKI